MNPATKMILSVLAALGLALAGVAPAPAYQNVDIQKQPASVPLNVVLVKDFESTCDYMARKLIIQPFVQQAPEPPIITVRPIENKSGLSIDGEIFQETIRVKLMKHAQGKVLFRDDKSRKDIILERANQGADVQVKTIDEMVEAKFSGERRSGGGVTGFGGTVTPQAKDQASVSATQMQSSAKVSGRLASADYFLRGLIFSSMEPTVENPNVGTRYWQFQFRVVDARTGIVVWEDFYRVKAEGVYR